MDRKRLDELRAKYPADKPDASHHPEFKRAIETIFAGTDRRPKPYEGVASLLGAPLRLDADLAGLDVALIGVPLDLGVTNRPGARFGPRAVRGVERIGPYHHVHRLVPLSAVTAADIGDVPFRSRYSLDASIEDIEGYFTRIAAAGVTPLSVGGDHSIRPRAGRWASFTSTPTVTPGPCSRAPSSTTAALSATLCWLVCWTPSAPSRSAFAAAPSTCGNSPMSAA
jgi:agmatinase